MSKRLLSIFLTICVAGCLLCPARTLRLSLDESVRVANDSSLQALSFRNLYNAGYWEWKTYKARRLPNVTLTATPAGYVRSMTQRYDSQDNIDVFRSQQTYQADASLMVSQNVDFLGGSLYVETNLAYLRNFGEYTGNQFSATPVRVGYTQSLIGFNPFRWERLIEPVKYEKVRRQYIQNREIVAEQVVMYFFNLALAQTEYRLAKESLQAADSLYAIGERRFKIASISQEELLTLKLDKVNARNAIENALIDIKQARLSLATYLGIDTDTDIEVILPSAPRSFEVNLPTALRHAAINNPELIEKHQSVLEARRDVHRTRVESRFDISFNASVGFNQYAPTFSGAYRHPLRQDIVNLAITIPLVDWGVRKGKYNMALSNLNVAEIDREQHELSIEKDVSTTVSEIAVRRNLLGSALEALDIADMAYASTTRRFLIGKADINSLTLAKMRRQDANKNYISALQKYWQSYYKLRRLTLYDFELNLPLE